MTAKQYLNQVRYLNAKINSKLLQLQSLRALAEKMVGSINERVQSSPANTFAEAVSKIADMENEINKDIDRLLILKKEIISEIDRIPNNIYASILSDRYISNRTWEEIAEGIGYEERQIRRMHGKALQLFEKTYNSKLKRCPEMSDNVRKCP